MVPSRQRLDFILVSVENVLLTATEVGMYLSRKEGVLRNVRIPRVFIQR